MQNSKVWRRRPNASKTGSRKSGRGIREERERTQREPSRKQEKGEN
jgi:hypothetical protein